MIPRQVAWVRGLVWHIFGYLRIIEHLESRQTHPCSPVDCIPEGDRADRDDQAGGGDGGSLAHLGFLSHWLESGVAICPEEFGAAKNGDGSFRRCGRKFCSLLGNVSLSSTDYVLLLLIRL